MKKLIIIPSREASTRLPNKPLETFGGKTLVQHVWDKAITVPGADVYVATDSEKILDAVHSFGGKAVMTDASLASGTDRVIAAYKKIEGDYEYIINLQGDMPFIDTTQIIATTVPVTSGFDVGTLVYEMNQAHQNNSNSVKAIVSFNDNEKMGQCHWFLRASLSYGYHHAGIYCFSKQSIEKLGSTQSKFELVEKLEQLRFLEQGLRIGAMYTQPIEGEINTVEDLELARRVHGN